MLEKDEVNMMLKYKKMIHQKELHNRTKNKKTKRE